jgi:hypothetical protein
MPYWCNYKIDFTKDELLKEHEQFLDNNEMFKFNGKWLNGERWYSLVKKEINSAKIIEELQSYEKPRAYLSIWENSTNSYTERKEINTSQDLQDFINMYYEKINNRKENEKIYPIINFGTEKFQHQKREKNKPKERLTDFYVVAVDKGYAKYFVSKLTSRRLNYSYNPNGAKQFKNEKEAQKWISDRNINSRFSVECSVEKATI